MERRKFSSEVTSSPQIQVRLDVHDGEGDDGLVENDLLQSLLHLFTIDRHVLVGLYLVFSQTLGPSCEVERQKEGIHRPKGCFRNDF